MENKFTYLKEQTGKENKYASSISGRSENNINEMGNHFNNPLNQNEDNLYKLYKNNMWNASNPNRVKESGQPGKKSESDGNVMEMTATIKIKSDDKDDWVRELKVSMIVNFPTHSKQQIMINITDPLDPLFLYILEIGEGEFHYLKQELSLLIEFQHFPQKFFEMLELCTSGSNTNSNSNNNNNLNDVSLNKSITQTNYIAVLHHNTSTNEALLIIQEITQFRQLNHLILRFKPATDTNLKTYLSKLVKEYKTKSEAYAKENNKLNENLESCYKDLKLIKEEVHSIKSFHNAEIENLKIDYQKIMNELKERSFEENRIKLEGKEFEKQNLIIDYENKIEELSKKVQNLYKEKLSLEDLKIKLEASERDFIGRNNIISSELKVYKEEVENLRSTTTSLNQNTFSQEKTLTELKIKNESTNSAIEEKEKNINNLTQLVDNLNKQKSDMEDNYKSIKSTNNKLEDKLQGSINEINKGNEIIQKLQGDLKSQKEKIKMNQQAMKNQEKLIYQMQSSSEDLIKNINELKREIDKKDEDVRLNKTTMDLYKLKIEEGEKKLEENSNVITYLNQRLNESYMPFKQMLKGDSREGREGLNPMMATFSNVPLSSIRNNFKDENLNEMNKNNEFGNTGSSFGNNSKQPYFNSMAFQSQGSFNYNNANQNNLGNTIGNNLNNQSNNLNNNQNNNFSNTMGNNNLNSHGLVLPETNFTNYLNKNNLNPNTTNPTTQNKYSSTINPVSSNISSIGNKNTNNLLSK